MRFPAGTAVLLDAKQVAALQQKNMQISRDVTACC
jgi:hypothetical protein